MTIAERATRHRQRRTERDAAAIDGLNAIQAARTIREAREIAENVLAIMKGRKNA